MKPEIDYGTRSRHEGKAWRCRFCAADNLPIRKLVFSIPKFHCECGIPYLDEHDLNFCLADVRVNGELLVRKILGQKGPECMANAFCQNMMIMHAVDCLLKDKATDDYVMKMDPMCMVNTYRKEYPKKKGRGSSSVHKFIKMALELRQKGIRLKNGTIHKIGDVSCIRSDDYEAICEEIGDGVPLLAVFTPGINYIHLKYCETYRPPLLRDFRECNELHKLQKLENESLEHALHEDQNLEGEYEDQNLEGESPKKVIHEAHMVVLLGPAFKGHHRDFYFADSKGLWLPRHVFEDMPDGIDKAVGCGIGKIEGSGLAYNVIKLWQLGETAKPSNMRLEDEDEYDVTPANRQRFCGEST